MIKCYLVAEGPSDVKLLSALLADIVAPEEVKIVNAGGQSSAISLARTFLVTSSEAVALLVDADATDPGRVSEFQAELEGSLADVAPRRRFGVFLAIPSLEVFLFEDQAGLNNEFGDALSPELIMQSRYEPKAVVKRLLATQNRPYNPTTQASLVERLDGDRLREAPVIKDLMRFLSGATQATTA